MYSEQLVGQTFLSVHKSSSTFNHHEPNMPFQPSCNPIVGGGKLTGFSFSLFAPPLPATAAQTVADCTGLRMGGVGVAFRQGVAPANIPPLCDDNGTGRTFLSRFDKHAVCCLCAGNGVSFHCEVSAETRRPRPHCCGLRLPGWTHTTPGC